jgi:predicted nuclease with TOPRIM domain
VADLKGAFGRREEQLLRDRDKAASSFERVEAHLKQCDDAFRRQLAAKTTECAALAQTVEQVQREVDRVNQTVRTREDEVIKLRASLAEAKQHSELRLGQIRALLGQPLDVPPG